MLKRFFSSIKLWVLTLFSKLHIQIKPQVVDNPISTTKDSTIDPIPIQKEIPWFTKESSLLDEFDGRETVVHGVGEVLFEGQKIKAITVEEPEYVNDMPDTSEHLSHIDELRRFYRDRIAKGETINYEDYARKH